MVVQPGPGEHRGGMDFARESRGTVRIRLTVAVSVIVGVVLLLAGVGLVRWVYSSLTTAVESRNSAVVEAVSRALAVEPLPVAPIGTPVGGVPLGDSVAESIVQAGLVPTELMVSSFVYVERSGGVWVLGTNAEGRLVLLERTEVGGMPERYVHASRRIQERTGGMEVHSVTSLVDIDRSVGTLVTVLWVSFPMAVLAVGVLTWMVTSRALAPVAAITERVERMDARHLDVRVPVPDRDDEIGRLARVMNQMLGRLQASGDRQRAFISDASHELRSPVAGIKVQLETALREDEHDTFGQALRTALGEVDRLERLVANLLALSRLDEGLSGPRGEVDVDDLVLEAGTRVGAGRIDLSGVSGGRVWGNRDELDGVVRNLLENAVRHANDRVEASVRVEGAGPDGGGLVVLTVDDDGAGISESDHEVVFERFGRLDEGRSRDAGGSGLGLALVKRVVESHDGTVSVTGSPLGGARFVVRLPAV